MKNRNPNGHYPPGVPPGGRLLQLPDSAKDQVQEELFKKLQPHLNELNQEHAAHESSINLVFAAEIRHGGVESAVGNYEMCMDLADRLAKAKLQRAHQNAFELFVEQKVNPRDLKPHILRSAARQGVGFPEPDSGDDSGDVSGSADVGTPAES